MRGRQICLCLYVGRFGGIRPRQLADLFPEVGGRLDKSPSKSTIGGSLGHLEQRRSCQAGVIVILGHETSDLSPIPNRLFGKGISVPQQMYQSAPSRRCSPIPKFVLAIAAKPTFRWNECADVTFCAAGWDPSNNDCARSFCFGCRG